MRQRPASRASAALRRSHPSRHRAARGTLLGAAFCAALAGGCADAPGAPFSGGPLGGLARELEASPPGLRLRLSVVSRSRPCPEAGAATPGLLATGCGGSFLTAAEGSRLAALAARAAGRRQGGDAEATHALALIDLLSAAGEGKPLERAISSLQSTANTADRPAPVLADLAAAYLVRAERAGAPRDLLAAIEASEEALAREPRNQAALFNRAFALQRFGLAEVAAEAWDEYLAADPVSEWAGRARRYRGAALSGMAPPAPAPAAPAEAYQAYAAADPQNARSLAFCSLLGAWGDAVLAADAPAAEARLARAEALARGAESRPGRDRTLGAAVRALRSAGGTARARRLARAHRAFAAACALDDQMSFHDAAREYGAAEADADGSPALKQWARLLRGSMLFHDGQTMTGESIFRAMMEQADTLREPALAGRARGLLTAVLLRGDRYESGMAQARAAAALFARAGEHENEGAALDAISIAQFYMHDMDAGYATAHRALERLRPYRSSYRLHNLLAFTAQTVANDGFPLAAVRMQDEGIRVASRIGTPAFVAEARLSHARILASAGSAAQAAGDLAAVAPYLGRIGDATMREWMNTQRGMVEATLLLGRDPRRAAGSFESAGAFFLGMNAPLLAFPAVVDGAQARLAMGDTARGAAGLDAALRILEHRRDSIRMEPRRAAVFTAARRLVDQMAMIRLAEGDTAGALASIDRGRATLAPVGLSAVRRMAPLTGEAALEYALVADTLLAWTVDSGRVRLHRATVDTLRLKRTVERLLHQMEGGAGAGEVRDDLAQLYEWLLRPVEERLGPAGAPLVVVADGPLAPVPFAALWNSRTRHYLVEDHALRFAVSLGAAQRPRRAAAGPPRAVFISDPAFDPRLHPGFERLSAAPAEVAQIAAAFPRARVLSGPQARWSAVRAALDSATLVHYAGHAVFDDERPERSYLLLAATPGQPGAEPLRAEAISELELRGLRLVVLSACRSIRSGKDRAAGFSGLAGAFLAAGAEGTLGTLWEIQDGESRPLMAEFYKVYRASGDGPGALREAQIRLLHSRDEALSSPSVWAGFRYAGN